MMSFEQRDIRKEIVIALMKIAPTAHAELRFGNSVFIGWRNASRQTFNSQRRVLHPRGKARVFRLRHTHEGRTLEHKSLLLAAQAMSASAFEQFSSCAIHCPA